jgi:hypothetical protein
VVYLQQIKKKAKAEGKTCHAKTTRLDLMKRGRGINGRDDRSSGIEIRMADAFAKINPTEPPRNRTPFDCFFFSPKKMWMTKRK